MQIVKEKCVLIELKYVNVTLIALTEDLSGSNYTCYTITVNRVQTVLTQNVC